MRISELVKDLDILLKTYGDSEVLVHLESGRDELSFVFQHSKDKVVLVADKVFEDSDSK